MDDTTLPHPAVAELLEHFEFSHLPPHLQEISEPFHEMAHGMAIKLARSNSPELTVGLRKLLEAKDCMVRAALKMHRNRTFKKSPQ